MTDLSAGTRHIVEAAVEEAAQAIIQPQVRLSLVPELTAALQGGAVRSVLKARVGMIVKGHTAENDDLLPVGMLPLKASKTFEAARALMHERCCGDDQALEQVRALLAEGVAFGLAAIDRLDRAMKREAD